MSFTPIVPDNIASLWSGLGEEVFMNAVNQGAQMIDQDFQATVATWKQAPEFTIDGAHNDGADIVASVSTDNEIYGYVTRGTEPHPIYPTKAKRLHFLSNYTAKTQKRVLTSRSGGQSGNDVFSAGVMHPGSEAREFDLAIQEKRQPEFEALVISLLSQAVSRIS